MTERQVTLTKNGQAVYQQEMNEVNEQAARGGDWLLADLLRMPSSNGLVAATKAIIPAGGGGHGGSSGLNRRPVVGSSGSADARVWVHPFTAVIGSLSQASVKAALRDIHTVGHYGDPTMTFDNDMVVKLQLAAVAGVGYRFDLIWARVEIDSLDDLVDRFVKDSDAQPQTQKVQLTKQTKITLGVTSGTESVTPARPNLPSDSAGSYYIALAYVLLTNAHTLTTKVAGPQIHEVFETAPIAASAGVPQFRPATGNYKIGGASEQAIAPSAWPPAHYQSPGAVGQIGRTIAISARDTVNSNVGQNAVTVLDDSVDWRKRIFRVTLTEDSGSGFPFSQSPGSAYTPQVNSGKTPVVVMGQSCVADASVADASLAAHSLVALLTDSAAYTSRAMLSTGAKLAIFVDQSDGKLKAWRNNVDANRHIFVWLEATGRHVNINANST